VQAIKGFYIHASAIVVVNTALLALVVVFGSPLALSSLADAEQVRAPTITQDVAALEGAGLVAQDPAPEDGRAALAGVRLFEEAHVRRLSALSGEMKDLATVARATDTLERLVHVPEHR
jgi:DNA-binding MarR family transcriptional regulator